MRTLFAGLSLFLLLAASARSGPSQTVDKSMTSSDETPTWYANREFNVQLWGTYLATANEDRQNRYGEADRYLEADHAWGGGLDAKYFFNRYVALGLEGYAASRTVGFTYFSFFAPVGSTNVTLHDTRTLEPDWLQLLFVIQSVHPDLRRMLSREEGSLRAEHNNCASNSST